MLKLEKVELRGFKSFCDYTEVTFPSHVTAIVGPNGCGKSNVADGITWVLGEQSARSLRGTRMDDLIFQGSRARPAVGMAEVNLTLLAKDDIHLTGNGGGADESEEQPQPEPRAKKAKPARKISAGEFITITRRLYRSGESEYLIDGQHSRLRDIHDLFAGTGLGPGHYAIIGQDRVAELINAKPFERRGVIEEAAGITKFKLRQRAIELRLESSKQNLLRLNDIITEIERQVGGLKRQAARARRYRRLREELRMLLRVMFRSEFHRIESELAVLSEAVEGLEKEKETVGAEIVSLEAQHRDAVQSGRSGESYVTEVRDQLAKLDLEIDRVQNRQAHCREQTGEFTSRRQELQREEQALVERSDVVAKESERLKAQLDQLSTELESDQQQLDAREQTYQEQLALVRAMEQELETLRLRFINEINSTANLRNARNQHDEAIRRLETQLAGLTAERQRAEGRLVQLIEERQQLGAEIAAHQIEIESLRAAKNESAMKLEEARRQAASEQATLSELEKRRIALENRRTSLIELDERHAYYSQAVQHLFEAASKQNGLHLLGTLADYTHVAPENERMVEAFMADRLQAVLVPSLEDARSAAELLDSATVGRAQFLVVGVSGGQEADVLDAVEETGAGDGVSHDSSFLQALGLDEAVSRVVVGAYPDCRAAEIVPDLTTAIESSVRDESRVFVTRRGEWARGGSLVSGGADSDKAMGLLAVKREIRELSVEINELNQRIATGERLLSKRSSEIEWFDRTAKNLDAALQEREKTLFEEAHRLSELERDLFRVEQQLKVIEFESSEAGREREKLAAERASLVSELATAEEGLKRLEAENKRVQDGLADLRQGGDSLAEDLSGLRIQLAAKNERRNSVALQLRRLENERAETEARIERNRFEAARMEAELATLEQTVRELVASFESLSAERAEAEGRLTTATASLSETRQASDMIEERLNELRRSESELRDRLSQTEVTRAQLVSEAKYLNEACQAELAQSLEEVLGLVESDEATAAAPADVNDPGAVRSRVEELRRKIEEIGPVNMMALEELQQTEERLRFLKTQREDIEKSIVSTEQGLQEIKRRSRQRFTDAFEAVNENFKEMFRELFGGGQGQMVLLDPENVLESGIDIIAQPPGKKLQNIHLLSGGEKAMTALSLLLAIFRFRPSPFCVLDEVDAPLDDVNVGRFSRKITEMSQQTQFILITHNKDTMEAAESLYGVTMEEPGVSKLISVRLK